MPRASLGGRVGLALELAGQPESVAERHARDCSVRSGCRRAGVGGHLRRELEKIENGRRRDAIYPSEAEHYQALYRGARGGLNRTLTRRLRTGRPMRRRRRRTDERRSRYVVAHQRIAQRPAVVTERSRIGDWEGDLVVGPMSRSAVATLVERRSRFLELVHLPAGHRAEHLVTALTAAMGSVPDDQRLTLTWDQGSEMARHDQVALMFSQGVFFADPGSPWMRGSNENMNGLVRQYLRKGTDLRVHTAADLAVIETKLNTRPRKTLAWRTPAEILALAP